MTSKVTPCVTMMICVAGCSSTTTQTMPYSRDVPPPPIDRGDVADEKTAPSVTDQLAAIPKPITVDVPIAVLQDTPPPKPAPTLGTKFQPVPDSYLKGIPQPKTAPQTEPYFTPLKPKAAPPQKAKARPKPAPAPAPVRAPIQIAEAILEPLIVAAELETPSAPQAIAYPQYVSVGPEYFGLDSEIAPYVISRSTTPLPRRNEIAEARPIPARPKRSAVDAVQVSAAADRPSPLPRERPSRRAPGEPLIPETKIAAIVPPRPDPEPRRLPSEPAPRIPQRTGYDRLTAPPLRDDPIEDIAPGLQSRLDNPQNRRNGWSTAVEKALAEPKTVDDEIPDDSLFRVRITPPEAPETDVASLDPATQIDTEVPADLSVVAPEELAAGSAFAPIPRERPERPRAEVQVAGTTAGIAPQPLKAITNQPANDTAPRSICFVNRGSNERMILVCEGVDVSKAQVFRAVVEGESAFRGLRSFDETGTIISTYGFNAERFVAMSQGPRSARDLAFLRALRNSGKQVKVKGRSFDLYLMKGDNNLATVLIEQIASTEIPKAADLR